MPRSLPGSLAALALAFVSSHGHASEAQRVVLEAGSGHHVRMAGVGWRMPLRVERLEGRERLSTGLLLRIARWEGREPVGKASLWDASATPFVSYALGRHWGANLFLEGGLGVHMLSHASLGERHFGSSFQFGEFLGAAARFGCAEEYHLGLRVEHVSNGGLQPPNDGTTYTSLSFAWRF